MAIPVAVLLGQAARLGIGAVARKWGRKKLIREIAKKTAKQKDLNSHLSVSNKSNFIIKS